MPLLVAAPMTMSVAQLFDLATFALMMNRVGPAAEANPLVAAMYGGLGLPVVAIAKVALLALVSAILAMLARVALLAGSSTHRMTTVLIVGILAIGIAAGLLGGATNTAASGLL